MVKISGSADIPPAVPIRCPHSDAYGVSGWPRGRVGQSAGTLCIWDDAGNVGIDMGQTVKLRGNSEGQRYRSDVATSHEHHVVAWR